MRCKFCLHHPTNSFASTGTNGGPGCSGLFGLLSEIGPFFPREDKTLVSNPNTWSAYANILFIESPSGVGFSYSDSPDDYTFNDELTADMNDALIRQFLNRFPHLYTNDFYLASESYGGHYIPTLADKIIQTNLDTMNTFINLKGFLVGNPYVDRYF